MKDSAKLTLPMKSVIFFLPYITYNANDTHIIYPPNINPIKVYSPISIFEICSTFGLFFKAVFESMKVAKEIKTGIKMIATVKLKFYVNCDINIIDFGGFGVNVSDI
jgi:hypothetical protein